MKEQWKKLDSSSKLLLNVEEGKPLPIRIELPISAFISDKESCCTKLVTVLRVLVLLILLLLLCWTAVVFFAVDLEQNVSLPNEQSLKDDENLIPIDNDSTTSDNFILTNDVSTTESINSIGNSFRETSGENVHDRKNEEILSPQLSDLMYNKFDANEVNIAASERDRIAQQLFALQKFFQQIRELEKLNGEFAEDEKKDSFILEPVPAETTEDETIERLLTAEETRKNEQLATERIEELSDDKIDDIKGIVNIFDLLFLTPQIYPEVQESSENNDSVTTTTTARSVDSEENTIANSDGSTEDERKSKFMNQLLNPVSKKYLDADESVERSILRLMAKYLEPTVGEHNELLTWYYQNKDSMSFEMDNDMFKVYTAKLLYDPAVAEMKNHMEVVLNLMLSSIDPFAKELQMIQDRQLSDIELTSPVQATIAHRLAVKLNMYAAIEDYPMMSEMFSKEIDSSNESKISALKLDVPMETKSDESGEAEKRKLAILEAMRKVANENEEAPENTSDLSGESSDQEAGEMVDSNQELWKIINALKKIANDEASNENVDQAEPIVGSTENEEPSSSVAESTDSRAEETQTVPTMEEFIAAIRNQENEDAVSETSEATLPEKSEDSETTVGKLFDTVPSAFNEYDEVMEDYY